jgi:hypothetical protein
MSAALVLAIMGATGAVPARAHPLGNFSIDHYSRLRLTAEAVELRYIIDMAELPTFEELPLVDTNGDGTTSAPERRRYLDSKAIQLAAGLTLRIGGRAVRWRLEASHVTGLDNREQPEPGSGLPTMRVLVRLRAALPPDGGPYTVHYEDGNFPERVGWKEIVVDPAPGVRLLASSAPVSATDGDPGRTPPAFVVPPQDVTAQFSFELDDRAGQAAWGRLTFRHVYAWMTAAAGVLMLSLLLRRWRGRRAATGGSSRVSSCGS